MSWQIVFLLGTILELVVLTVYIKDKDNLPWRKKLKVLFAMLIVIEVPTYLFNLNCAVISFVLSISVFYQEYIYVKTNDMSQPSITRVWVARGFFVSFLLFIIGLLALFGEIS